MLRVTRIVLPSLIAAGLAVAWLHTVPASNAYAQSQSNAPGLSGQRPEVSDQKLDAAAAAIKQIAGVREDYGKRIEAAEPAQREHIADEAKNAMAKAITDQGLSLPEYSSILVVAQNDPRIQEKLLQRLSPSDK
jgi:hypothetical protein